MFKLAYGVLNLKPKEFWALSWPEFWMMYEGWKSRRQYEHEHTRYLAAMMVNTSFNAPKKAISPRSLYELDEIDGDIVSATAEEIERFREHMSRKLGREIHFTKTAQA